MRICNVLFVKINDNFKKQFKTAADHSEITHIKTLSKSHHSFRNKVLFREKKYFVQLISLVITIKIQKARRYIYLLYFFPSLLRDEKPDKPSQRSDSRKTGNPKRSKPETKMN